MHDHVDAVERCGEGVAAAAGSAGTSYGYPDSRTDAVPKRGARLIAGAGLRRWAVR